MPRAAGPPPAALFFHKPDFRTRCPEDGVPKKILDGRLPRIDVAAMSLCVGRLQAVSSSETTAQGQSGNGLHKALARAAILWRLARLACAPGSIACQRTRPEPHSRSERWWNVVHWLAAVAAMFIRSGVDPQPLPARLALRVNALHGPSWQIAHGGLPNTSEKYEAQ